MSEQSTKPLRWLRALWCYWTHGRHHTLLCGPALWVRCRKCGWEIPAE